MSSPVPNLELTRRESWKLLGAGTLLVFTEPSTAASGEMLSTRFHVGDDGTVTLLTGKIELGQGSRSELTQVVAEELGVEPARVVVLMGDTDLVPDDGGTWASLTTPETVPVIRRAAAAARPLLSEISQGEPLPGGVPDDVSVKEPSNWEVCGTSLPRPNRLDIVTGRLEYSGDIRIPGMLHGKVVRPDAYWAELVSYDASAAEELPGVTVVHDGDILGLVAPDRGTAEQAARALKAEWRAGSLVTPPELFEQYKHTAGEAVFRRNARYPALVEAGSLEDGFAAATRHLEARYTCRNIAHVPLQPRSAIAVWEGDRLTIHADTQVPFGVRRELARAFDVPEADVRIISTEVGGGFGCKHRGECPQEAARLARAVGQPVRVSWTREEEFRCSYTRPAGLMEVTSGFTEEGVVTAWEFHNYNSGAAGITPPYAFANHWNGYHPAEPVLYQGPYRSLSAVANAFARETQMEEMAEQLEMGPLEFRLRNIDNARLRTAIERAADRFGWGNQQGGDGRGYGMSVNIEKGAHIALFVELESDGSQARLLRAVMAFDCGAVINPDHLRNQIAGAFIMGTGGALFEELRYDATRITNPSLSQYRVPRFSDVPDIEILLIDRREEPSAGAGESPITVVAPAIGAALHQATGRRFRDLPMLV